MSDARNVYIIIFVMLLLPHRIFICSTPPFRTKGYKEEGAMPSLYGQ